MFCEKSQVFELSNLSKFRRIRSHLRISFALSIGLVLSLSILKTISSRLFILIFLLSNFTIIIIAYFGNFVNYFNDYKVGGRGGIRTHGAVTPQKISSLRPYDHLGTQPFGTADRTRTYRRHLRRMLPIH